MNLDKRIESARKKWNRLQRGGRPVVYIGSATCGLAAGAGELIDLAKAELRRLGVKAWLIPTGCIGICYAEPLVDVQVPGQPRVCYCEMDSEKLREVLKVHLKGGQPVSRYALGTMGEGTIEGIPALFDLPVFKPQVRIALRNCGVINPEDLDHYLARDGYRGLMRALSLGAEGVIDEVTASGLRGRGGGGFPTGQKWKFCRNAPGGDKYLICNADEGDPGAFMDRSVLEGDPHAVLEGMCIAAFAIGARHGYVYIRAEYPLAIQRLKVALAQMREMNLLGEDILGSGFSFDIQIKEGAGAFVCGEETALMASIEGRRGMPRPRPPFPAIKGLFGQPSNINNVETLANIPAILRRGASWFAGFGTESSRGTKTFALTGKVKRTGLIEVPMGISLRSIVYDIGGGIEGDGRFKAAQTGGPSGGCIPASAMDVPIDYEHLTRMGTIMGSGGLVIMDEDTCMVDLARYFLTFTNGESCGKCAPCRLGTRQMLVILEDICSGRGREGDIELLERLGNAIRKASLCGLGQTAPNPVLTTIRYFRHEYEEHIRGYCSSGVCKRIAPAPCQRSCPIGMDVPSYNALVAWGRFDDALEVIHQDNPFPAVCGRICPRPCEANCVRAESDEPVSIRGIKRFVADLAMREGLPEPPEAEVARAEKVAVVGAGPCGLTAAHELASLGYGVTVFESRRKAGGMLRHAVPDFRLSGEVVDREVARIASRVEIRVGKALGKDFSLGSLLSGGFDAVLLALGAPRGVPLGLEGLEGSRGLVDAVKFLTSAKAGRASSLGTRVVVIGSGHLAVDAARTAVRLGSSRVTLLYPRSREDLPVSGEDLREMTSEGVVVRAGTLPVGVVKKGGKISGVRCVKARPGVREEAGRQRTKPGDRRFTIPGEAVIAAIGHLPETGCLSGEQDIARGVWGNLLVDPLTLETGRERVFAAGDVVTGGATVIEAIAAGQRAAVAIHRRLRGLPADRRFKLPRPRRRVEFYEVEEELGSFKRPAEPLRPASVRKAGFDEARCTYPVELAVKEAKRCLRCDLD